VAPRESGALFLLVVPKGGGDRFANGIGGETRGDCGASRWWRGCLLEVGFTASSGAHMTIPLGSDNPWCSFPRILWIFVGEKLILGMEI
jgi:hypothetical protein